MSESKVAVINSPYGEFNLQAFLVRDTSNSIECLLAISKSEILNGMYVRLNSGCITSETFGDSSCDCHWQLCESMRWIDQEQSGLIVHSAHEEGRGIGLFEKVNSMSVMRTERCSSADAFKKLGQPTDRRTYEHAILVLRHLKLSQIRLLSNNKGKLRALESGGIEVLSAKPLPAVHMPNFTAYMGGKGIEPIVAS